MPKAKKRSRRKPRSCIVPALAIAAVVLLLLGASGTVAFMWLYGTTPDRPPRPHDAGPAMPAALQAVVDDLDKQDPDWRLGDWYAHRKAPAANSATIVLAAARQLPDTWPPEALQILVSNAPAPMDQSQRRACAPTCSSTAPRWPRHASSPTSRKGGSRSRSPAIPMTRWCRTSRTRKVAGLLAFDVRLRLADGDPAGALQSCLAQLNAARAIGDEPSAVAQLVRLAMEQVAVDSIERVIGDGRGVARGGAGVLPEAARGGARLSVAQEYLSRGTGGHARAAPQAGDGRAVRRRHQARQAVGRGRAARLNELLVPSHVNFLQSYTAFMAIADQPARTWEQRLAEAQARRPTNYLRSLDFRADLFIRAALRRPGCAATSSAPRSSASFRRKNSRRSSSMS